MAESSKHPAQRVIIDLRCLQDPNYATRGIGQHARGLILNRPPGMGPVIGLIDPRLALPESEILESVDEIRRDAYFPVLAPGTVFINPSPMTADPLFIARLVGNSAIRRIAVVYDFIPLDDSRLHLPSKSLRMSYASELAWLAQYDLFLPISDATQRRLNDLLGPRSSIITGVPLPPWCAPGEDAAALHILAVAGDNPRKNPETVIRAHAASSILQAQEIPLIVTGSYAPEAQAKLLNLAQAAGGDPALLRLPGHVTNEVLRSQYQNAVCVVTASRAEGFSLPVVEAMAAGVPSIASDIPPHAELVTDPALRFQPDDSDGLRVILERIVLSPDHRAAIIAAQARVWPAFEAKSVGAKIWSTIRGVEVPARLNIGGAHATRPRIAMLAPFAPDCQFGAFSIACAAALSAHAELVLFAPEPKNPAPIAGCHVAPLSALPHLMPDIDRVVSLLGNPNSCAGIHDLLLRYGGAAICDDSALPDFQSHAHETNLLEAAAQHARPLILHSQTGLEWVRKFLQADAQYPPVELAAQWSEYCASRGMANYARRLCEVLELDV